MKLLHNSAIEPSNFCVLIYKKRARNLSPPRGTISESVEGEGNVAGSRRDKHVIVVKYTTERDALSRWIDSVVVID